MNKMLILFVSLLMIFGLAACSNGAPQNSSTTQPSKPSDTSNSAVPPSKPNDINSLTPESTEPIETKKPESSASQSESSILVVYISQPDDVDDSTVVIDGETLGSTQYMANVIQDTIGADIFRITPETPYPTEHEILVDLASEEQANTEKQVLD